MATYTTNLNLKKPDGTETLLVADINNNMDTIDTSLGALDSTINLTSDILTDAVSATTTKFFMSVGSGYTGDLPRGRSSYKYGVFIVNRRANARFVIACSYDGYVATNYYDGTSWVGWKELGFDNNDVIKTINGRNSASFTLINCSGTVTNALYWHQYGNVTMLEGRVTITNYVRSGANPGFDVTLPNSKKSLRAFTVNSGLTTSTNSTEGVRADEQVNISGNANSGTISFRTTETYTNMASATRVVFSIFPVYIETD